MSELYREQILEHYNAPHNYGVLDNPDVDIELDNPTCGDTIHLTAQLDTEGRISRVAFEGHGCVISMASASMFTDAVIGKTPVEVADMGLSDIQEMMGGIRLSMGRIKCATLPLVALQRGLKARP